MKAINACVKYKQTKGAQEAVRFQMAQSVAKSPEDLRKYVAATQPQIHKLLTEGGT